ncbi:hypothetical protein [Halomonas denitrificans]|nr:hypothetical protein [Halomonas denitrificans]
MNSITSSLLLAFTLVTAIGSSLPSLAGESTLDLAERALDGDLDSAARLLERHDSSEPMRLVAAIAHRKTRDDARALELMEEAMANGYLPALWVRVVHHVERHEWIEAYAWGRLAMLVRKHEAEDEIDEDAWPMEWTWQFTQQAARNLREEQFPLADRRTEDVVARWYADLTTDRADREYSGPAFEKRRAPTYPRDEAHSRETGWSLLMMQFEADGDVARVLPIAQTHPAFSERAEAALEHWVIDSSTLDEGDLDRGFVQLVEFGLRN